MLKSLLKIARQWRREKFAILTLKPRSHVRILIYLTWAIRKQLIIHICFLVLEQKTEGSCNYFEIICGCYYYVNEVCELYDTFILQ